MSPRRVNTHPWSLSRRTSAPSLRRPVRTTPTAATATLVSTRTYASRFLTSCGAALRRRAAAAVSLDAHVQALQALLLCQKRIHCQHVPILRLCSGNGGCDAAGGCCGGRAGDAAARPGCSRGACAGAGIIGARSRRNVWLCKAAQCRRGRVQGDLNRNRCHVSILRQLGAQNPTRLVILVWAEKKGKLETRE